MPQWVIMPWVNNAAQTVQAAQDVLAQTVDVRLLLIDNGSTDESRAAVLQVQDPRVFHWRHDPPLPSLAATWNTALGMCWAEGATEALVVNNDIRLPKGLYAGLLDVQQQTAALFVSAVNVGAAWYPGMLEYSFSITPELLASRGGPDFSCFLITGACHRWYRFDEGFTPAYCEDLDYHRRLLLAGEGADIFSVNLPFLHYASGTLKAMHAAEREQRQQAIGAGSRAHYLAKWGGPVNQERYTVPFDPTSDQDGVTTPELQRRG